MASVPTRAALPEDEKDGDRRRLLDSLFAFVGVLLPDGTMIDANQAPLEAAGLSLSDVVGRKFWDTYWWSYSPAIQEELRAACDRALRGETSRYETVVRMKGDSRVPVDFMLVPLRDPAGRITHLIPSGVDISKRLEAERDLQQLNAELERRVERRTAALRESEERFRAAMQHSPIGMAMVALDGRWLDVNRALCRLIGYSRSELQAIDFQTITHPDDLEADLAKVQEMLRGEIATYQMEKRYRHKDGHVVWVQLNVSLVSSATGVPQYFISQIQDITARKLLERAMQTVTSELLSLDGQDFYENATARLAELLDADIAFVCTFDSETDTRGATTLAMVEQGALAENMTYSLEHTPCDEVRSGQHMVVHGGVQQRYPQDSFFAQKGIEGYAAIPLKDLDGKVLGHLCAMRKAPLPEALPIEQTMRIFGFAIAAAMVRERNRQQYRDLVEFAPDALIMLDAEGAIQLANERAEALTGWSREELQGKPVELLLPSVSRAGIAPLKDELQRLADRRAAGGRSDLRAKRRSGGEFPVEISVSPIETEQGTMMAVGLRDITERRAIEEQLRQSQRLDAVGKLTGGVAHDFNNLLTVILGSSEELEERFADDPELQEVASTLRLAATRGADLTRRLLVFSRKQTLDPKPTDLEAMLGVMRDLLRRTLGEHIEIKTVVQGPLWPVQVDGSQLENAILNLCINARDAMPGGGRLTIETRNVHLDGAEFALQGETAPGDYVMLRIADNGAGMDRETLAHAFEPFFTTKEVGKGSGLGLSMVYGFIKQSRGHVQLTSVPGRGTEVTIYLPRSIQPSDSPTEQRATNARGGSERILVVEDDDLVRTHVATQLTALGYAVTTASDGPEAAAILESGWEFDLLMTDMVMPGGLTGQQLGEWAQRLNPELPVLLSSGYSESMLSQAVLKNGFHLLSKPYRRQQLAAKVREILDGDAVPGQP